MKIAILGNFSQEITPSANGGTEAFTYALAEELAKRDFMQIIDVYGVGENPFTNKKINFISVLSTSVEDFIKQDEDFTKLYDQTIKFLPDLQANVALKSYYEFSRKGYDVIHNNSVSSIINSVIQFTKTPTVTTLHTNVDHACIQIPYKLNILQNEETNNYFVAVANHQINFAKKHNIHLNFIGTVYNGTNSHNFTFKEDTNNHERGIWVGRIYPGHNKGLKEALIATKKTGKKLVILSSIEDHEYYEKEIKPEITENVNFISQNVPLQKKIEYYQNASYLLFPIIWEEPFGLIFIEAMSCGTPVIAFARGAVPEIIKDGQTGFIVNASGQDIRGDWIIKKTGIEGLCEAIERINNMPAEEYRQIRLNCRKHVENNFTVERMVDEYMKVYNNIITNHGMNHNETKDML